jgi:nucleotide-binding universal stress UspA family protein
VGEPVFTGGIVETPMVLQPEDPLPYLRGVVTRLQALGVTASATALEGRASGEILRHLQVTGASLLCMTTHGRSGLSRLLLGSVAEEILRKSPCPVLLRRTVASAEVVGVPVASGIRIY